MKLLIGLGNPGKKFEKNRHNVGHLFVEMLKQVQHDKSVILTNVRISKTDCFMNESGGFVKQAVSRQQIAVSNLYVAHDDLDIPIGSCKIQFGKGPKIHNGVNSIEEALGTSEFWRIRIGVDGRDPQNREAGDSYVLKDFTKEELKILEGVFDAITRDHSFPS